MVIDALPDCADLWCGLLHCAPEGYFVQQGQPVTYVDQCETVLPHLLVLTEALPACETIPA